MTRAEAEELLEQLKEHYGEAVLPASKYCKALNTWAATVPGISDNTPWGSFKATLFKSGLAARLVYRGEELRTEQCMLHKGTMYTSLWCFGTICICEGSGWIPTNVKERCCVCTKPVQYLSGCIVSNWRSASGPVSNCKYQIAYCKLCSNMEKIEEEVVKHLKEEHTLEERQKYSHFENRPLFDKDDNRIPRPAWANL